MKAIQELVAYFDRRGQLSHRQLKSLLETSRVASDAPSSLHGMCGTVGTTYYFRVTGQAEGTVWGTDVYTRDSALGVAAVHAGLLKPGETQVLRLKVVPAPKSYPGSLRNGVTTLDYGDFPECWSLSAI
jgi:LCCL domain